MTMTAMTMSCCLGFDSPTLETQNFLHIVHSTYARALPCDVLSLSNKCRLISSNTSYIELDVVICLAPSSRFVLAREIDRSREREREREREHCCQSSSSSPSLIVITVIVIVVKASQHEREIDRSRERERERVKRERECFCLEWNFVCSRRIFVVRHFERFETVLNDLKHVLRWQLYLVLLHVF